jgi:hypothetical protein
MSIVTVEQYTFKGVYQLRTAAARGNVRCFASQRRYMLPHFDAGHENGKQMNEFAAHEQLRAIDTHLYMYTMYDVMSHITVKLQG